MRADELAEDGHMEGRAVGPRIMKAIEELLSEKKRNLGHYAPQIHQLPAVQSLPRRKFG